MLGQIQYDDDRESGGNQKGHFRKTWGDCVKQEMKSFGLSQIIKKWKRKIIVGCGVGVGGNQLIEIHLENSHCVGGCEWLYKSNPDANHFMHGCQQLTQNDHNYIYIYIQGGPKKNGANLLYSF